MLGAIVGVSPNAFATSEIVGGPNCRLTWPPLVDNLPRDRAFVLVSGVFVPSAATIWIFVIPIFMLPVKVVPSGTPENPVSVSKPIELSTVDAGVKTLTRLRFKTLGDIQATAGQDVRPP